MGQAKRRGNMSERVELAFAWEEAYDEKWERERPLWAAEISRRQAAAAQHRVVHSPHLGRIALVLASLLGR